jgi:hypothetical protein
MTPWTEDQPVSRPLPTPKKTQTQNKRTDIHALNGIGTHDLWVRAREDSSCPRPLGHWDRQAYFTYYYFCCLRIVGGGVQTWSTRHRGHLLSYYICPGWLWGWRIWWNEWQRKPKYRRHCPPQIPLDQTRDRTRAAAVGSQRLTAWAMARPYFT